VALDTMSAACSPVVNSSGVGSVGINDISRSASR
jgi:hypothetical protein